VVSWVWAQLSSRRSSPVSARRIPRPAGPGPTLDRRRGAGHPEKWGLTRMTDDPVHCDRTRRIRAPGRPLLCPIRSPGTGEDTVERDLAAWGRRLVEVAAGLPTAAELGALVSGAVGSLVRHD